MTYSTPLTVNGDIVKYCSATRKSVITIGAIYTSTYAYEGDSTKSAMDVLTNELDKAYVDAVVGNDFDSVRNVSGIARAIKVLLSPFAEDSASGETSPYKQAYLELMRNQATLEKCIDNEVRDQEQG